MIKRVFTLLVLSVFGFSVLGQAPCTQCEGSVFKIASPVVSGYSHLLTSGNFSFSHGYDSNAEGLRSVSFGRYSRSTATDSYLFGTGTSTSSYLINNIQNSFMVGFSSTPALFVSNKSVSYGDIAIQPGDGGVVMPLALTEPVPVFTRQEARVGIGTTTPESALHVLGAIKINLLQDNGNYGNVLLDVRGKAELYKLKITSLNPSSPSVLTVGSDSNIGMKTIASIQDNMGDHVATKDIQTNGKWIRHSGSNGGIYLDNGGNMGLGTSTLTEKLHLGDEFVFSDRTNNKIIGRNYKFDSGSTYRRIKTGVSSMISFNQVGDISFYTSASDAANSIISSISRMKIGVDGSVSIGTENPIGYKLAVNGKIGCKGVVIENNVQWPDYVFADDYSLRSLNDVESFIGSNGHLPEVPSAEVISAEGVDLGDMSALLLKKIEELTLYLIEQNKRLDEQQKQIEEQQRVIERLSK